MNMSFPLRPARLLTLLFALFSATLFAADASTANPPLAATFAVPAGLTNARIKDAIISALQAREWKVEQATDNRIAARLIHRGVEATMTFTWDDQQIRLYSEGWEVDKKGVRGKPEFPKRWVENMKKDLPARLGVPAAAK
jgi:hypothetical protein